MIIGRGRAMIRAIQVHKFGGSEVLNLEEIPKPVPRDNEVLVQVKCSGVNPVDTYIRGGMYAVKPPLPYIPGKDGAGVVEEVGSHVKEFKAGDRVFLNHNTARGTLAEYCVLREDDVFLLHERLSFAEGAAIGVPYFTAYRALYISASARPGQRVLVHGASGAVGQAAVQLAAMGGMVVVGTAGSAEGSQLVKECGAEDVYNHRQKGYLSRLSKSHPDGFDIILEMLADVNLGHDLPLLRRHGTVVVIGSRGDVKISPRDLMGPETRIVGCALFSATEEERRQTSAAVLHAIVRGVVRPRVAKQYPLQQASQAHDDLMSGQATLGKLVVDVGE